MSEFDLESINDAITDRSHVFYWQTDRALTPEQAAWIWSDRHSGLESDEIISKVNNVLVDQKIVSIEARNEDDQKNLGNINSVRGGTLDDGEDVIIRIHPKGVANGYFSVESLISKQLKELGLPAYGTYAIHDSESIDDFAFQVIEQLPGFTLQTWLNEHPEDEEKLLMAAGKMLSRIHKIPTKGFGPFDNEKAKNGDLVGIHPTLVDSARASLENNLEALVNFEVLTQHQSDAINEMFSSNNPFLNCENPVLVHNDFADWNMLTDGNDVTGLIDWDESISADPIFDIACWSTFFDPNRLEKFLEGYRSEVGEIKDFKEKFELYRLRYTISKMTLRLRKYSWDPSDFVKEKIEAGKLHLAASLKYYDIA